jgi:hypothetical protein
VRGAKTLVIALAVFAAVPAVAAAKTTRYSIVKANGFERVTFTADSATCASFGTCGDSGRVNYRFGGKPGRGSLVLRTNRRGRGTGTASFRTAGTTTATVNSESGTCTDTVRRRREAFSLVSESNLSRLLFTLHPRSAKRDYLETDCLTPSEAHLARTDNLPQGSFRADDFDNARTSFRLSGENFFRNRGYRGSVKFTLGYRVARR